MSADGFQTSSVVKFSLSNEIFPFPSVPKANLSVNMVAQELARGITKDCRSKAPSRRKVWAVKKKNGGKLPVTEKTPKAAKKEYHGRFYPAEDAQKPLNKRIIRNPTKLRESITPGTVLILLAGRFKGKRVVFLKQLDSGLLLVTGPFKLNGVPTRRVNQCYVIATSTKVTLPEMDLSKFEDSYFKAAEKRQAKKSEEAFFDEPVKNELAAEYIANQKAVDGAILKAIAPEMKGYLSTTFSLKDGDRPHLMKF